MRTFFQCSLHIYTLFTSGGKDIWQRWVQVAETLIAESSSFSRREESDSLRTQKVKVGLIDKIHFEFFCVNCDILFKAFGSKHCKVPKNSIFSFFYPLSHSWSFNLSCPRRLASQFELGSQVGLTTVCLVSCCLIQHIEYLSTTRAELAKVIANRALRNWVLQFDKKGFSIHYQVRGVTWIGQSDRRNRCDVLFVASCWFWRELYCK